MHHWSVSWPSESSLGRYPAIYSISAGSWTHSQWQAHLRRVRAWSLWYDSGFRARRSTWSRVAPLYILRSPPWSRLSSLSRTTYGRPLLKTRQWSPSKNPDARSTCKARGAGSQSFGTPSMPLLWHVKPLLCNGLKCASLSLDNPLASIAFLPSYSSQNPMNHQSLHMTIFAF